MTSGEATARAVTARDRRVSWVLLAIIVAFAALALAYNATVPVFNAPDEPYHFEYVRYLAERGRLPNQAIEGQSTSNEGFNPPLYYLIVAGALSIISPDNGSDLVVPSYRDLNRFRSNPNAFLPGPPFPRLNPLYVKWGRGRDRNMFLRAEEDRFPFRASMRSVHLLRAISPLFGAATLLFLFKTAKALAPERKHIALLATAICAFNPQFTFVHSYLNNDALVTTLSTLSLWLLTRFVLAERISAKWTVALGVSIGIGLLSKVNIAFLCPVALLAIVVRAGRQREGTARILRDSLVFVFPILLISGWYYLRNAAIYGFDDPLGWELRAAQNPELVMPPALRAYFFREVFFQRLFTSSWGHFDWLTIVLSPWQYRIYGLVSLTGLVGVAAFLRRARGDPPLRERGLCLAIHLVAIALALGSLVALNFAFVSAQGRLIFPVIAPLCTFIALGLGTAMDLLERVRPRSGGLFASCLILLLLGLNFYALVGVIAPVYP